MQFNMDYFWDIQDWLSELPDDDIQHFTTYIVTKGSFFVVECDNEELLCYMALRWSEIVDNRLE